MTALILAAAGSSTRIGGPIKKQYIQLGRGTVLSQSAKPFLLSRTVDIIIVTVPAGEEATAQKALFSDSEIRKLSTDVKIIFVTGGTTRQESVFNALKKLSEESSSIDFVLIHDGARPFVTEKIILDALKGAEEYGAAVPALIPVDTQKETDSSGFITRHLARQSLAAVQTPQAFRFIPLFEAHKKASTDGCTYTDDTEIWGKYCGKVKITTGDYRNIKITYAQDIQKTEGKKMIHIGLGYDIHPLVSGRRLILGGVVIPFEKGEDGHSDGDVLFHAVTDALLGAAGMGDIGSFFPPEQPEWKDANSAKLLSTVWGQITVAGWSLVNMDCVVKLEKPKFLPYRDNVIKSIADVLGTDISRIFVKAKTGEKMGDVGNGNAIEAWCTCLLEK